MAIILDPDCCQAWKVECKLSFIFILIIYAVIAGDEDRKDIEGFGHIHLDFF